MADVIKDRVKIGKRRIKYSEVSQAMLVPDRLHLFSRRELAARGGGFRAVERGALLGRRLSGGSSLPARRRTTGAISSCKFSGQAARGFNGLFQKLCHA
jgi:hypothetical protein